jgi:hypothetical protein
MKLSALAVMLVSVFAVATYYAIPDSRHMKSIAFALGPSSMNSVNSTVFSLATDVTVTFQNGTEWNPSYYLQNLYQGEINSTDIIKTVVTPVSSFSGGLDLDEPYLIGLQYAFDWEISTSISEKTMDLGTFQLVNMTYSGYVMGNSYPIPENFSVPNLNYTLQENATGYWNVGTPPLFYGPWTWWIDSNRTENIISNASNPAEVNFDLDLTANVYYQIMTNEGTQSGYATVEWSGRWGTFQLFHEGDQLLGLRYDFTDIGLRMMAT